jgi:hypothetical protein
MFDYASITAIHEYLQRRFAPSFIRCMSGKLERWGDARTFDIAAEGNTFRLTVAHAFIDRHNGPFDEYFDSARLPTLIRAAGSAGVQVTAGKPARTDTDTRPRLDTSPQP